MATGFGVPIREIGRRKSGVCFDIFSSQAMCTFNAAALDRFDGQGTLVSVEKCPQKGGSDACFSDIRIGAGNEVSVHEEIVC